MDQPLILIVDDEHDLVTTIEYSLEKEGYRTRVAHTGKGALEGARLEPLPDLILLDVLLPDVSGLEVCRELRSEKRTKSIPIVMLTARAEEIDRVVGFEMGADDYVVKPFSNRELALRIRAILRRQGTPEGEKDSDLVVFGVLEVDTAAHQVFVEGDEIALTALELKLLRTLMDRKGRVQSRETLLRDVWDITASITTRTVDTHVKRLREKLKTAGVYVETVRGTGYRFKRSTDA